MAATRVAHVAARVRRARQGVVEGAGVAAPVQQGEEHRHPMLPVGPRAPVRPDPAGPGRRGARSGAAPRPWAMIAG